MKTLIYRFLAWFYRRARLFLPVYYVNSGEALPPPLSKREEDECIRALAKGDLSVRQTLIERNLRLVVYIARKFENTGVNVEDLISIGTIGLIKAVNTFDTEKRIKLATYASRCIENEILMYLRRSCRLKLEVSLDEPLNIDWDGNELSFRISSARTATSCRNIEDEVDKELLSIAMRKLLRARSASWSCASASRAGRNTRKSRSRICWASRRATSRGSKAHIEHASQGNDRHAVRAFIMES